MVEPYCGLCGRKRVTLSIGLWEDLRCPNTKCQAFAVGLWIDDGLAYDMILKINKLAGI